MTDEVTDSIGHFMNKVIRRANNAMRRVNPDFDIGDDAQFVASIETVRLLGMTDLARGIETYCRSINILR